MTQKIFPLYDRLVIEVIEEESISAGGVYIPDTAKEKSTKGKVMWVGSGRITDEGKTIPMTVKEGDTVLFSKFAGTNLNLNGKKYLLVKENDILAILK